MSDSLIESGRSEERVVVAMSGGVDSSVAAMLLVEQGYDVVGVMLQMWREPSPSGGARPEPAEDARQVAAFLGIPFHLVDCRERFRECVVEYFVRQYACARTPNPCLACNRHIKFGFLLDVAQSLGARYLATGHYARVRRVESLLQLWRGRDRRKDQSYVLYMLGQEQLACVLFPLGDHTKTEVRAIAAAKRLPVADKGESQEVCFISDNDYRRFLRAWAAGIAHPGPILLTSGEQIGEHQGLAFYTIGQRKGMGIAWPEPLYVLAMDAARNALIVGPAAQLGRDRLLVQEVSFVSGVAPPLPQSVTTKIRYAGAEVAATVHPAADGKVEVRLARPLRDITPGQAAVFYRGEVVLGGGIIETAL